jgi:Putative transmembrane protein (PGPGW)
MGTNRVDLLLSDTRSRNIPQKFDTRHCAFDRNCYSQRCRRARRDASRVVRFEDRPMSSLAPSSQRPSQLSASQLSVSQRHAGQASLAHASLAQPSPADTASGTAEWSAENGTGSSPPLSEPLATQALPAPISVRFPASMRPALDLAISGAGAFKRGPLGVRAWLTILAGSVVMLVGVALLVLPGPGSPLVIAGLAMLAPHWPWAQRVLDRFKATLNSARTRLRNGMG